MILQTLSWIFARFIAFKKIKLEINVILFKTVRFTRGELKLTLKKIGFPILFNVDTRWSTTCWLSLRNILIYINYTCWPRMRTIDYLFISRRLDQSTSGIRRQMFSVTSKLLKMFPESELETPLQMESSSSSEACTEVQKMKNTFSKRIGREYIFVNFWSSRLWNLWKNCQFFCFTTSLNRLVIRIHVRKNWQNRVNNEINSRSRDFRNQQEHWKHHNESVFIKSLLKKWKNLIYSVYNFIAETLE